MINALIKENKSFWLVASFATILTVGALISEFFQAPTVTLGDLKLNNPINSIKLAETSQIRLTNRFGSFTMVRLADDRGWELVSPRKVPVNQDALDKLFSSLRQMNVKKIYPKDQINMANFSLINPPITIELTQENSIKQTVKFGVVNPIDDSTYMILDNKNIIHQVKIPKMSFNAIDIGYLIDSRIFTTHLNNIASIEIYKGKQKVNSRYIAFTKNDKAWKDSRDNFLVNEKVESFLGKLLEVKSSFIIDEQSQEVESKIKKYLETPLYTIVLKDKNDKTSTFVVSSIVNSIPDLKIEKKQNVLMHSTDRRYPYLFNKSILSNFKKLREKDFRQLNFKKLFY